MHWIKIDMQLLFMKGHYFAWNAGTVPIMPFMSIYAKQLGFSSFIVGIIFTVLPIIALISKPIAGGIVDKYKNQKKIFLMLQVVASVGFLGITFLPGLPTNHKINFTCSNSGSNLNICDNSGSCVAQLLGKEADDIIVCQMDCLSMPNDSKISSKFEAYIHANMSDQTANCIHLQINRIIVDGKETDRYCLSGKFVNTSCDMYCNMPSLNDMVAKPNVTDADVYNHYQFWLLLAVYMIASVGNGLVANISDTICFQILGDKPHKYGVQRMFGALGWGIFSIISGSMVDIFSRGEVQNNYTPTFSMAFGILIICVIVSYKIEYTQQPQQANLFRDMTRLLFRLRVFIFIFWCSFIGACCAVLWNFLFWLLEDLAAKQGCEVVSWIKTIEGLTLGIQCLAGELPFFFLSTWILKKIGHIHAMTLVLLFTGVRFILYSVIISPWLSLPIAPLSGGIFALFYSTMTSYASIIAPRGAETTTQALTGAAFQGLGVSLGSFIGGILMRDLGPFTTYRIFGIASLIICVVHATVQFIIDRLKPVKGKESNRSNLL